MEKIKVLFFSRLFYPHIGGVEKHVLEISKLLVKRGYSITVITEQYDSQLSTEDEIEGIKIVRINTGKDNWFKKFRIWKEIFKKRKLLQDADVIHTHDIFFWYLPFRFLFPTKKVYVTFHGYEGNTIPGFKAKFMHKIAEVLSKGNICVGDFLKKWYGTKPDYVIYGGIKISNFKSQVSNKYKIQNPRLDSAKRAKYKILFVGRLEEETGIMEYLKALKILKKKKYKFEIIILGDGSLRKKAENFSKKNKINAKFKGFVEKPENHFSDTDFVFASRYLGILEALAYRKFVFAHYNNSIKKDYLEMSPFAKFISISNDCEGLSLQIEYFLENMKKKEAMLGEGFSWVKDNTWYDVTSLYLRLWKI